MKKSALLLTLCSLVFTPLLGACGRSNPQVDPNNPSTPVEPNKPLTNLNVNINYTSNHGTVSFESKEYKIGDKIKFSFDVEKGYAVSEFLVNNKKIDVYQNEAIYTILQFDINLEVSFVKETKITLNYNKEGGSVSYPEAAYKIGDILHIGVEENDGYYLAYVNVNGQRVRPIKNDYRVVVDSEKIEIEVLFEKIAVDQADFTFVFDHENHTAAIKSYLPDRERIPHPFIVPETVKVKGIDYKINRIMKGSLDRSSIKAIELSKNIEIVDVESFGNVHGMGSISVAKDNQNFASKDGVLYSKDFKTLVAAPTELETLNFIIPDTVETVAERAFLNNRLVESIVMNDNVKTLSVGSFQSMRSLKSIKLSSNLLEIPEKCFDNAINLEGIEIPNKVVTIQKQAFNFCPQFRFVTFPSTLKTIGDEAFNHCQKLQELNFNEGLETIGRSAFGQVEGIEELIFPSTLKSIETAAFEVCINLRNVTFNKGLLHLGGAIFAMDPELGDIVIPSTVETIDFNPFFGNARTKISVEDGSKHFKVVDGVLFDINQTRLITFPYALKKQTPEFEYVIPNTVVELCEDSFATNTYLTKLTIPVSVKRMYLAFENILPAQGGGGYKLELVYEGSMEQFLAIDSGDQPWNYRAFFLDNIVKCNDGNIDLTI